MSDMKVEHRAEKLFILDFLRWFAGAEPCGCGIPRPINESLDWRWLIDHCRHHCLLPFLSYYLQNTVDYNRVPAAFRTALAREVLVSSTAFSRTNVLYADLLRQAACAGLTLLPLKGVALAKEVYHKLPYRRMQDCDVLVRESSLPDVVRWLLGQGFDLNPYSTDAWRTEIRRKYLALAANNAAGYWFEVPFNPFGAFNGQGREALVKGNMVLDLHWTLIYSHPEGFTMIDATELWNASEEDPECPGGRRLACHHLFLHTLVHASDMYHPSFGKILDCLLLLNREFQSRPCDIAKVESALASMPRTPQLVYRLVAALRSPESADGVLYANAEILEGVMFKDARSSDLLRLSQSSAAAYWGESVRYSFRHFAVGRRVLRDLGVPQIEMLKDLVLNLLGYLRPRTPTGGKLDLKQYARHWRERRYFAKLSAIAGWLRRLRKR
jgi:hypothetical protein